MPRAGLSPAAVVDHALDLIDAQGADALTLAAVAAKAGVATPSLYKHVSGGLAELRRLVAVRTTEELTDQLAAAVLGLARDEAVRALLAAYAEYALRHPRRYAALPQAPDPDPELQAAAERLVNVLFAVLRGYGLDGSEAVHAVRTLRATAHGYASLSTAGAFQLAEGTDTTLERLTGVLVEGLANWPGAKAP
ncbi:TetR-like C-terminal domain-containing protein [Streptomyces sp. TLI_171]|uniref:TetR-like C-terminal domain-containing protein n=1 Tax=Streptomyces sp. TLI_171 TaxID=1938859 RepID=UPI000C17BA01|nr:TetR-like C-terminal domain-containing protein [Streptomyces sp. TLI_171]RKE20536.1 TetR family transcriptional regulator [Streptomyces sp. TLI_171]